MRHQDRTVEQELARIADLAYGVVTYEEMVDARISRGEIRHRLQTGALLREYPGVYRVGHQAPSTEATYLAAVRACGDGALLCGRAAGHLLMLFKGPPPPPEVVTRTERRIKGIRTKRSRRLDPRDGMVWRGIPVTTVARTLVDLAAELRIDELARVCHEAGVRYGTTPAEVDEVLGRRPTSPGANKLRRIMSGDAPVTLSRLEKRFLRLLREHRLPRPETNRPAGSYIVDCRWPEHKLTVELDSYRFHRSRHAWERDRRREREAYARGDAFRRYTWGDVFEDRRPMMRELAGLLSA
jgi:very-short-patch-repair endonuclease